MQDYTAAKKLQIASWPGYGASHNPFVRLFLDGLAEAGCDIVSIDKVEYFPTKAPDIVLLHWAERIFGESQSRWQMIRKIVKLLRALSKLPQTTKVVWLVHNLAPHDARKLQRIIWPRYLRQLIRHVDAILTLSPGTVTQVQAALPALAGLPSQGLWHPSYPDASVSESVRLEARARYGWTQDEKVLGYCGQIRPYKGVEDLLTAFLSTTDQNLRLFISGRPGRASFAEQLAKMASGDPRVALDLRNLSNEEFKEALSVCDRVVAPFRDYLHSGSLVHALSASCPILTPVTPFSASLKDYVGAAWVNTYDGTLTADILSDSAYTLPETDSPDLTAWDPITVGQQCVDFLTTLKG